MLPSGTPGVKLCAHMCQQFITNQDGNVAMGLWATKRLKNQNNRKFIVVSLAGVNNKREHTQINL